MFSYIKYPILTGKRYILLNLLLNKPNAAIIVMLKIIENFEKRNILYFTKTMVYVITNITFELLF